MVEVIADKLGNLTYCMTTQSFLRIGEFFGFRNCIIFRLYYPFTQPVNEIWKILEREEI